MPDGQTSARPLKILIGSVTRGDTGPVPTITRAFIEGLSSSYRFVAHRAERRFGGRRTSRFNFLNLYYLLKHFALWVGNVIWHRPDIAHYPVTSFWNFEKSMLFLRCARLGGARTIGHLHGGAFIDFWKKIPPWRKRLSLPELQRLQALVVLSDGWKQRIEEHIPIAPERVFVVNNPIDRHFEETLIDVPVRRTSRIILALGVVGTHKGVLDLISAAGQAASSTEFQLKIVGPEREPGIAAKCRRSIAECGLQERVTMQGGAWGEQKEVLFREAALFVFPSYIENFPLVVIEAAAAGLPIISTPVGAIPEFFRHESSALFVEPGNVPQIREAIVRLMNDPAERERLGEQARDVFRTRLSRTHIMAQMERVYRHVGRGDARV